MVELIHRLEWALEHGQDTIDHIISLWREDPGWLKRTRKNIREAEKILKPIFDPD